jgi:hypothetical protein
MKDLETLKHNSLKHRLAMARNYGRPEQYLRPEEMPLYEQEIEKYKERFSHLDLSGDYRPEKVDGKYYIVGHGQVSHPVYDFEAVIRLLIQKEQALKST